jgi:predicted acylesterase/phospholipase RssA
MNNGPGNKEPANKGNAALILPGGGARGAYQVGVLKAVRDMVAAKSNPFPIICGTSAGAINAAVLASHAHEFETGVDRLLFQDFLPRDLDHIAVMGELLS